jgi:transposase
MIRLSDEQWERIRDHFPEEHIADGHPGRKPIPTRRVLEAVLWILNTGAQWHMLPQSYPNYKTVHRRPRHHFLWIYCPTCRIARY